jgi:hypothetical protein
LFCITEGFGSVLHQVYTVLRRILTLPGQVFSGYRQLSAIACQLLTFAYQLFSGPNQLLTVASQLLIVALMAMADEMPVFPLYGKYSCFQRINLGRYLPGKIDPLLSAGALIRTLKIVTQLKTYYKEKIQDARMLHKITIKEIIIRSL